MDFVSRPTLILIDYRSRVFEDKMMKIIFGPPRARNKRLEKTVALQ
jgi:hypothetical protein